MLIYSYLFSAVGGVGLVSQEQLEQWEFTCFVVISFKVCCGTGNSLGVFFLLE